MQNSLAIFKKVMLFSGMGLACFSISPKAEAVIVPDSFIANAVTEHVQTHLTGIDQTQFSKVQVDILNIPGGVLNLQSAETLEDVKIELRSNLNLNATNRGIVQVKLLTPKGQMRSLGIPVKVALMKPVWVAKQNLPAKVTLKPSNFTLEERDVSLRAHDYLGKEVNLASYHTRVQMRAGEMLDTRKLVITPMVSRNEDIKILLSSGEGLKITIPGRALEDGIMGEQVHVKRLYKQGGMNRMTSYTGKVIGKNRVLVEI